MVLFIARTCPLLVPSHGTSCYAAKIHGSGSDKNGITYHGSQHTTVNVTCQETDRDQPFNYQVTKFNLIGIHPGSSNISRELRKSMIVQYLNFLAGIPNCTEG